MADVRLMRVHGFIFILNDHFNDIISWPCSAIWPAEKLGETATTLAANEVFWPHFSRVAFSDDTLPTLFLKHFVRL